MTRVIEKCSGLHERVTNGLRLSHIAEINFLRSAIVRRDDGPAITDVDGSNILPLQRQAREWFARNADALRSDLEPPLAGAPRGDPAVDQSDRHHRDGKQNRRPWNMPRRVVLRVGFDE